MNSLNNIRVVLVEPIHGGNIGSICRAINNNGITQLYIVNPSARIDWNEAKKLACNAKDQLSNIKKCMSIEEAIRDCSMVAGTTARKGSYRNTSITIED